MNADDQPSRSRRRSSRSGSHSSSSSRRRSSRRSRRKSYLAALLALALLAVVAGLLYVGMSTPDRPALASAAAPEGARKPAERTAALAPVKLPADDAPHGSGMEWWYYNGILDAKAGQRYAFHVAVFVANGLVKQTVMHVALTDLQSGRRYAAQGRTGGLPARHVANGFDFRQDDWQVTGSGPSHSLHAAFDGVSIALDLADAHAPVLHRAAGSATPGLLDFGQSGISYYYSRPRMAARGEITVGGKAAPVSGEVWFDHQWGDFDVRSLGWNWFALHLADGSDLMLYQLFDAQGHKVMTAGTRSTASGAQPLQPQDIELTPVATWKSPHTGIPYVVEWRVQLPSGVLDVKPIVADSEFDAGSTTENVYWEGAVKVTGSVQGQGFLELSGYDHLQAASSKRK